MVDNSRRSDAVAGCLVILVIIGICISLWVVLAWLAVKSLS